MSPDNIYHIVHSMEEIRPIIGDNKQSNHFDAEDQGARHAFVFEKILLIECFSTGRIDRQTFLILEHIEQTGSLTSRDIDQLSTTQIADILTCWLLPSYLVLKLMSDEHLMQLAEDDTALYRIRRDLNQYFSLDEEIKLRIDVQKRRKRMPDGQSDPSDENGHEEKDQDSRKLTMDPDSEKWNTGKPSVHTSRSWLARASN